MKYFAILSAVIASVLTANASWYWPFGSDDEAEQPRVSELMEPASLLIDDATDLAADGKYQEAIATYRKALDALAQVELDHPDRAETIEFTSLRNKRAYVNAAIDTLLLAEARNNAKAVSITDTTELEKKYLERKGLIKNADKPTKAPETAKKPKKPAARPKPVQQPEETVETEAVVESETVEAKPEKPVVVKSNAEKLQAALKKDPKNRKLRLSLIGEHINASKFDEAKAEIAVLLDANMTDSSALNLKAVCEASQGDFAAAEKTLDTVIQSHPRNYNGYYNMANLKLQVGNKNVARYYYETGRAVGGPKDAELEAAIK